MENDGYNAVDLDGRETSKCWTVSWQCIC